MEKTLLDNCRFCKHYSQTRGTQGVCQLMNVPVHGEWQACRMGALVFTCEERLQAASLESVATISPSAQPFQYTHAHVPQDEMWLTGSTYHSRQYRIGQEAV
jgi:cellulase/cellobiase CelA1